MYLISNKKEQCTGCTLCANKCPVQAIKMEEDEEGFLYPKIDKQKCIKCGKCEKICPNQKNINKKLINEAYGVKHKDENERFTSRSGAAFIALSDYILDLNGVVYGATLNEDFTVSHTRAENIEERNKFKGSKYLQSNMKNIIEDINVDLNYGKKVLFSGTACQVIAVKEGIKKENEENLYTCDVACYGVPSKKIFEDYIKYIELKENKKVMKFNFRNKKFGWNSHIETLTFEDGTEMDTQYFRNLFMRNYIIRPSCYNCKYTNINRISDITIADFWGIEKINPDFYDEKGVSLILVNSTKGQEWFENIKEKLEIFECDQKEVAKYNWALHDCANKPNERKKFWNNYKKYGFEYIMKKFAE